MSYLLVLAGIEGAAGAFVVLSVFGVVSPLPQPVNTALMTTPNSTISANILFIVGVRLTKSTERTSTIFGGWGTRLRACSCTRPRNLARNAQVFHKALRWGAAGDCQGKSHPKLPTSQVQAMCKPAAWEVLACCLRIPLVFPWYSLGILLVFSSFSSLALPWGLPGHHAGPTEPVSDFDSTGLAGIQKKSHFFNASPAA